MNWRFWDSNKQLLETLNNKIKDLESQVFDRTFELMELDRSKREAVNIILAEKRKLEIYSSQLQNEFDDLQFGTLEKEELIEDLINKMNWYFDNTCQHDSFYFDKEEIMSDWNELVWKEIIYCNFCDTNSHGRYFRFNHLNLFESAKQSNGLTISAIHYYLRDTIEYKHKIPIIVSYRGM